METSERLESALNAKGMSVNVVTEKDSSVQAASKTRQSPMDRIASTAHQAVDKIAQAANQAVETFDEKSKHVKETQVELADSFRLYIKEHPAASVGVAAATGFLIRHLLSFR